MESSLRFTSEHEVRKFVDRSHDQYAQKAVKAVKKISDEAILNRVINEARCWQARWETTNKLIF